MTVWIDGGAIWNREELHDVLSSQLRLPDWYGRNLDALYDCLTEPLEEETEVHIQDLERLRETLGGYADGLLSVLRQAERENPRLHVFAGADAFRPGADGGTAS